MGQCFSFLALTAHSSSLLSLLGLTLSSIFGLFLCLRASVYFYIARLFIVVSAFSLAFFYDFDDFFDWRRAGCHGLCP